MGGFFFDTNDIVYFSSEIFFFKKKKTCQEKRAKSNNCIRYKRMKQVKDPIAEQKDKLSSHTAMTSKMAPIMWWRHIDGIMCLMTCACHSLDRPRYKCCQECNGTAREIRTRQIQATICTLHDYVTTGTTPHYVLHVFIPIVMLSSSSFVMLISVVVFLDLPLLHYAGKADSSEAG